MELSEALNVLRLESGPNDELVTSLCNALPDYISLTTGMSAEQQATEPLVKTVEGFLIRLWYFGDKADDVRLNRTIDSLLKAISLKAK